MRVSHKCRPLSKRLRRHERESDRHFPTACRTRRGPTIFRPPISRKQKRPALIDDLAANFLALKMSPNLRFAGSSFERNHALFVAGQIEGAGRPSHFSEVAVLRTRSGSMFRNKNRCSRRRPKSAKRNAGLLFCGGSRLGCNSASPARTLPVLGRRRG